MLGGAAYLLAMCHQNGFSNDMFTYTAEERAEAVKLANEIVRKKLI